MVCALGLLLLQLSPANAQTRWPIETLAVEGNRIYSSQVILQAAGLKVGQPVGKEELETVRNRLMQTGVFGSVGYQYGPYATGNGLAVTLQVVEVEPQYPFRFERLDAPAQEIEDQLRRSDPLFRETIPPTRPVLDRYVKVIESYLAARNGKEAVIARVTPDDSGRLFVVFSPAALPPSVAAVEFAGNSLIPSLELQRAIARVAVGVPYTESGFRQMLDSSVRPLYETVGRIRVTFPELHVEKLQDVKGVSVTVRVVEGDEYKLRDVRLAGEGIAVSELTRAGQFKTGEVADFSEVANGLARIKAQLHRQGFLKPETAVDRVINDEKKQVDLVVHVDHGPRYVFGALSVEGLDLNGEAEIRRRWGLKPGAPFDVEYPDYFLNRVREDGLFDNLGKTKSSAKVDDKTQTVDVTLVFQGEPKGSKRAVP